MDEFFLIEKQLGEVKGIFSACFASNQENNEKWVPKELKYEEFEESVKAEEKAKAADAGSDDEPIEETPPAEEEEEGKTDNFRIKDHQWTITNGQSKDLMTLFMNKKRNVKEDSMS